MTHPALYQAFAQYNRKMNERVYEICSKIPDEERKQDRGAFFKSIHSTLNHLIFGDRAWMNRLADKEYPLGEIGSDFFDSFDVMDEARRDLDADICQWVEELTEEWLLSDLEWTTLMGGGRRVQPRWLLVSHMFNHQTHHRGQLSTLLTQAGHDIGVTDLPRLVL